MKNGLRAEVMTITPQQAERYLLGNKNFRKIINRRVDVLAEDMENLLWEPNGETIKFNGDGSLIDGQHRLLACVKSRIPFETVVVWGVKSDLNIDTGVRRRYAQWLAKNGEKETAGLVAALNWQAHYEAKDMEGAERKSFSVNALNDTLKENPRIRQGVEWAQKTEHVLYEGGAAFCYYQFIKRDEEMAKDFRDSVATGENLKIGDGVLCLRNRVLDAKIYKKLGRLECIVLTIKAWNGWRTNTPIKNLMWRNFGPRKEGFPGIV